MSDIYVNAFFFRLYSLFHAGGGLPMETSLSTKCRLCTTPVVSLPLLPHNPPPIAPHPSPPPHCLSLSLPSPPPVPPLLYPSLPFFPPSSFPPSLQPHLLQCTSQEHNQETHGVIIVPMKDTEGGPLEICPSVPVCVCVWVRGGDPISL